jgi:hypothetical protein
MQTKEKYPPIEDPIMEEVHKLREELHRQFKESGYTNYFDWLKATEKDLEASLAEVGFRIVKKNGYQYLEEIEGWTDDD